MSLWIDGPKIGALGATSGHEKGQAILVAPLQPHTLAAFRPWGFCGSWSQETCPGAKICTLRPYLARHGTFQRHEHVWCHRRSGQFCVLMVLYLVNMNLLAEWYVAILALLVLVVFLFTGTVAARKAKGATSCPLARLGWLDDGGPGGASVECSLDAAALSGHCPWLPGVMTN